MKAVVMAGGEGTRLRPLTCNLPKPMVPLFDKPVMQYSLELLRKYGVDNVAVTLQYLPQVIKDYFGDGTNYGLSIEYYVEDSPLGTAGSVKNASRSLDETFIVISGDAITDFPLAEAFNFHSSHGALATIVLTRVSHPLEYGLVLVNQEGKITRFLEKPSWGEVFSDTVNTGIYILEPEVLDYIDAKKPFDFSKDLFPLFLKTGKPLYGCILSGYWCDIGNHEQYRQVHIDALDGKIEIEINGNKSNGIFIGEDCRISSGSYLEAPYYLGNNCEVKAGTRILPYTVIGKGTMVESGASLKRTITWSNAYIGKSSEIRGAILGKGVSIKNRCHIFEGSVIGDDSVLEDEVTVKPEVKIWPQKIVETRRVVTDSIVWSEKISRGLFTRRGVTGDLNSTLSPEMLVRLGRAIGSFIPMKSRVLLGRDWSNAALIAKNAFIAGLMSSGIQVVDAGRIAMTALRYATREIGFTHGYYLGQQKHENLISLNIFNEFGANIAKNEERKIENIFKREEYRPILWDRLAEPEQAIDLNSGYINALLNQIDVESITRERFLVTLAAENLHLTDSASFLFDRLGCKILRSDGITTGRSSLNYQKDSVINNLVRATERSKADLGVYFYDGGQKVTLVTPYGHVIEDEELVSLITSAFASHFKTTFLSVDVPVAIEKELKRKNHQVVRTRAFHGDLMQAMLSAGEIEQMQLFSDGIYAAMRILELMACHHCGISDILQRTPSFYYHKTEIPVSWENKGRLLRRLAEDYQPLSGENLIEGLRIQHAEGNSLILPDEDRPVCRIYSEAFSQEIAESLTDFYIERIESICQEEEDKPEA
ncbi:MAG: sugar phosphate nucleotidyltransferase [Chitinophagales bacterium]